METIYFFLGILVSVGILVYQSRAPLLKVSFRIAEDGNPAILYCDVSNSGRGEARDVYVSFNRMIPMGTKLFFDPEVAAQLIETETPPDPSVGLEAAALQKAFAVSIPRVAPNDTVSFELRTIDEDNLRAAKQVMKIRQEIYIILTKFGSRLKIQFPQIAEFWDTDLIFAARIREENFFLPGILSYERGREKIELLEFDHKLARAHLQDLYKSLKKEFIDLFKNRQRFKAPVIKVKTAKGESTFALMNPFVSTFVPIKASLKELKAKGFLYVTPPIPKSYD